MQPRTAATQPEIEERDPAGHIEARTPALPVPPQDAAAPAVAVSHSPRAIAEARHYGFSDEEIALLKPAELLRELRLEKARVASQPAPQPAPQPPAQKGDQIDWGVDAEGKPYTEANYPAPVAKAIRAAHEAEKERKANQERIERLEKQLAESAQRSTTETLTNFFSKNPKLYGADPINAVPGSPEHARQAAVIAMVKGFTTKTTLANDLAKAHGLLFGVPAAPAPAAPTPQEPTPPEIGLDAADVARRAAAQPRDPVTGQYTQRQFEEGATLAPTQRTAEKPAGRQTAVEAVAALQRSRGHYVPAINGDNDLGVPD